MPVYEYVCQDCGAKVEVKASVAEYSRGLRARCTECGSTRLIRVFSSIAVGAGAGAGPQCGPMAGPGCCN